MLVTFEAEVKGIGKQYGKDKVDLVIPPVSLRADFPVSVVDKVVDERGSRKVAKAYLQYLYTPEAQEIIATHFNRPIDKDVAGEAPQGLRAGAAVDRGGRVRPLEQRGAPRQWRHPRPALCEQVIGTSALHRL